MRSRRSAANRAVRGSHRLEEPGGFQAVVVDTGPAVLPVQEPAGDFLHCGQSPDLFAPGLRDPGAAHPAAGHQKGLLCLKGGSRLAQLGKDLLRRVLGPLQQGKEQVPPDQPGGAFQPVVGVGQGRLGPELLLQQGGGLFDLVQDFPVPGGFQDVADDVALDGPVGIGKLGVGRQEQHLAPGPFPPDGLRQFQAADAGHFDVGDQDVHRRPPEPPQGLGAGIGPADVHLQFLLAFQKVRKGIDDKRLVVNQQYPVHGGPPLHLQVPGRCAGPRPGRLRGCGRGRCRFPPRSGAAAAGGR